jgi:hypothetical protein
LSAAADRYARAVTTDEQPAPETPASAPAEPTRSHRVRSLVLILVAFALVLGGLAAGTAFYFYDKATATDRSTPEVATQQFLNATLIQKDPNRAGLFVCDTWTGSQALAAVAPPSGEVTTTWGDPVVSQTGGSATVTIGVQFSYSVGGGADVRDIQSWTLRLEKQDGWRVCGLTKNGSLNP